MLIALIILAILILAYLFSLSGRTGHPGLKALEGFSYAIDSGLALAQCFLKGEKALHSRYRRSTLKLRLKLFSKVMKSPFMYNPFLRMMAMKSGISSIKMIDEQ